MKQRGAEEACRAHNPEVVRSNRTAATNPHDRIKVWCCSGCGAPLGIVAVTPIVRCAVCPTTHAVGVRYQLTKRMGLLKRPRRAA